jgi:hypothetical protein
MFAGVAKKSQHLGAADRGDIAKLPEPATEILHRTEKQREGRHAERLQF